MKGGWLAAALGLMAGLCLAAFPRAAASSPSEPPPKCEISRGAWCFLKGPYQIEFSPVYNVPQNSWTISEKYWHSEAGVILEATSCEGVLANTIEVVGAPASVSWQGKAWKQTTLRLRKDGRCDLLLLVPTGERAQLNMAASVLATNIAACLPKKKCEANIVAPVVFRSLTGRADDKATH